MYGPIALADIMARVGAGEYRVSAHGFEPRGLRWEVFATFYAEMSRVEGWSTRDLAERIDSMLYERTALSKKPEKLIQQELWRYARRAS